MDRPTPTQQQNMPRPSSAPTDLDQYAPTAMEEGEIDSRTDQDPSILEVPAINWARYVGVRSVQCVKMEHAQKITTQEDNNWDLEQDVRENEENFSTDLQLLLNETTNDPTLLKTLVCLERQQHDQLPNEYQEKVITSVRSGLHRGQNNCPKEHPNSHHQPPT